MGGLGLGFGGIGLVGPGPCSGGEQGGGLGAVRALRVQVCGCRGLGPVQAHRCRGRQEPLLARRCHGRQGSVRACWRRAPEPPGQRDRSAAESPGRRDRSAAESPPAPAHHRQWSIRVRRCRAPGPLQARPCRASDPPGRRNHSAAESPPAPAHHRQWSIRVRRRRAPVSPPERPYPARESSPDAVPAARARRARAPRTEACCTDPDRAEAWPAHRARSRRAPDHPPERRPPRAARRTDRRRPRHGQARRPQAAPVRSRPRCSHGGARSWRSPGARPGSGCRQAWLDSYRPPPRPPRKRSASPRPCSPHTWPAARRVGGAADRRLRAPGPSGGRGPSLDSTRFTSRRAESGFSGRWEARGRRATRAAARWPTARASRTERSSTTRPV